VTALGALLASWRGTLAELRSMSRPELQLWHDEAALLALVVFGALALVVLVVRSAQAADCAHDRVAVPAILSIGRSGVSVCRHGAAVLFVLGALFFALALADPYTSLTSERVTFPGRRISLVLDASDSMLSAFIARQLNADMPGEEAFFTTVGAAEHFVRLRMAGGHRDLMALVEFGDEAYVITPFTTDYENLLTSLSLIANRIEWETFPDRGTTIARAIHQGIDLFRTFEFLDASGNLMVIFSDGGDAEVTLDGRPLSEILGEAVDARVPVYFVRLQFSRELGQGISDATWKDAVERTGGRFYAAADEPAILRALADIDRRATGTVSVRRYSTDRARFAPFALMAVVLWTGAALSKLTVPWCRRFP
jgi:hypothetical protein